MSRGIHQPSKEACRRTRKSSARPRCCCLFGHTKGTVPHHGDTHTHTHTFESDNLEVTLEQLML